MSSLENACCFCLEDFGLHGNDPWPLQEEGRCCDVCNRNLVIKARIQKYLEETQKDVRSFNHEESSFCECRVCMLKEYVHIDRDYEIVEEQNSPPTMDAQPIVMSYESSLVRPVELPQSNTTTEKTDVVKEYHETECDECGDYYTDHRGCRGMTPEEIAYEDYVAEWSGPGCFGRY